MATRCEVPDVVLALANSRRPRRPSGTRTSTYTDPLALPESAQGFLWGLLPDVTPIDIDVCLEDLRLLRKALEEIVTTLTHSNARSTRGSGSRIPEASRRLLNSLASRCAWTQRLTLDLNLDEQPVGEDLVGRIASTCVRELADCDPTRLKVCEREECGLFFYDTTRNRSARWHAENPCGWRERAERRQER